MRWVPPYAFRARRVPTSRLVPLFLAPLVLGACEGEVAAPESPGVDRPELAATSRATVRQLAARRGANPLPPPRHVRPELVRLGQALLFDKELSGDRDISCMSCHLPSMSTGDGRHLAIGQGGTGLGLTRIHPEGIFIPRNAPPLFNLHALDNLFWDGRVSVAKGKFHTPAGEQLTPEMTRVFEFGAISAVGLFPVENRSEMRGFAHEVEPDNELLLVPDGDFTGVWSAVMARLGAIPEYVGLFEAAYPGTRFADMTFAHASNAMAGFMVDQLYFADTPWDRFLRGADDALTTEQLRGAELFFSVPCSICHGGPAFTDDDFHNVVLAQFGPGQGDGLLLNDDFGRFRVDGDPSRRYAFRSTPLRNVELTGPYGHAGQFVSLRDFIDHYSENDRKLREYDVFQLEPALQATLVDNFDDILATRDALITAVFFTDQQIDDLTGFMLALTDDRARNLDYLVPERVPSGLPIDH